MTEPAWKQRFRAPRVFFPQWSRDDPEHLIYLSNLGGKMEVFAWDRRARTHRRVTDRSEGTGYRVPSRLDPAGRAIWWWNDAKGNELGVWMREPFAGGAGPVDATGLAPAYSAGLALHDGLAVVGRSTGAEGSSIFVVRDGSAAQIYAHRQPASVGGLSRDGRLLAITHAEHGDSRNRAVRIVDLDGRAVAERWDGPGRGLMPALSGWSPVPGDERLIVMHERTGRRWPLLFDAATDAETELSFDLPGELSAGWYPDARALLLEHDHRGRTELYRFDLASGALVRLETEPGTIASARVRPDGVVWYLLDRSAEPPVVRAVGNGTVLAPPGERAPAGVAYRDADVGQVHVFVAEPAGSGPRPAYFFIHGGPEAHDRDAFSPTVQAWVDHGFTVVCLNYRGSSGYGKAWRDAILGRPGLTELEDIAAVRDWAVASGAADPRQCFIGGGSWGGYLTLLALGVQPELWAAGIGIVPIGDYVAAFEDEMEPLKRYDAALFGGTPAEVPESYRRSNPLTYIERVRAPMLLLVGLNDPRCPARSVDVYTARLRELGMPFDEYRYDAGHGSLVVDEQLKQVGLELDFAAKHVGTTAGIA